MSSRCSLARRTALTLKGALRWRVNVPLRGSVPAHGRGGAHVSTGLALSLHSGGTEDREPSGHSLLPSCAWKVSGLSGPSTAYSFFQFIKKKKKQNGTKQDIPPATSRGSSRFLLHSRIQGSGAELHPLDTSPCTLGRLPNTLGEATKPREMGPSAAVADRVLQRMRPPSLLPVRPAGPAPILPEGPTGGEARGCGLSSRPFWRAARCPQADSDGSFLLGAPGFADASRPGKVPLPLSRCPERLHYSSSATQLTGRCPSDRRARGSAPSKTTGVPGRPPGRNEHHGVRPT